MRAILHQLAVGSWFPALFRFAVIKKTTSIHGFTVPIPHFVKSFVV